jgi:hypothetical protein
MLLERLLLEWSDCEYGSGDGCSSEHRGDLCHALQHASQQVRHERKAFATFLTSHKCQLQRAGRSAGAFLSGAHPQYGDWAIEELMARSDVSSGALVRGFYLTIKLRPQCHQQQLLKRW